jgi:membrane protein DedA with SNARE-associated domain
MNDVIQLIHQHGALFYVITYFWTALEGETFVIFAALAAQKGLLSIWGLFFAAWLGSFCGDQAYFYLGRKFGRKVLGKTEKVQAKLEKVFGFLERNSTLFILTYRFMYGIRNVSSVAIGMSKLAWRRFVWLNLIAAGIWAMAFCGFGYLFGDVLRRFGRQKEEVVEHSVVYELTFIVLGIVLAILVARWGYHRLKAWRVAQKVESLPHE